LENFVKPPFSVPVENKPYIRPVLKNTADLHLTYWPLKVFKLGQNHPYVLAYPDPETLQEREYEGRFFR